MRGAGAASAIAPPTVSSIGIPDFRQMAFKYDVLELSCAVKPYCFQYLFREYGYDRVIYFDPDVFVYSSLDAVFSLLDDALLVLTPHLTKLEAATDRRNAFGLVPLRRSLQPRLRRDPRLREGEDTRQRGGPTVWPTRVLPIASTPSTWTRSGWTWPRGCSGTTS